LSTRIDQATRYFYNLSHLPMRQLSFLCLLLSGLAAQTQAQAQAKTPTPTQQPTFNAARLDSLLDGLAANNKLMGSLALSRGGQPLYSRAFGYADAATKTAATPATRYRIGSITKVFTATMIMQLVDERKLTLDAPLSRFFPQLPNAAIITVDQLLSHRSGLHNFTSDPAYGTYMSQPKTQAELLTIIGQAKTDFEPGAKYAYSNSNYVVLGFIVEKLTKLPYAQAVQQRIGKKAGLTSTYYGGKIDPRKQEALSYERAGTDWKLSSETDMSIPGGAGALVATPADLNRFLSALFGGKLVSASSLTTMRTMRDGYGRGLMEVPFGAKKGYGHSGGIDEFASRAYYFPDGQLAVAVCANGGTFSLNDVLIGALSVAFNKPYKIPSFAASTYVPASADLDRYVGTYASAQLPLKITFTREGNVLRSQASGQSAFALEAVSAGVFRFEPAGIVVEFEAGKPSFVLRQGGGSFGFVKE